MTSLKVIVYMRLSSMLQRLAIGCGKSASWLQGYRDRVEWKSIRLREDAARKVPHVWQLVGGWSERDMYAAWERVSRRFGGDVWKMEHGIITRFFVGLVCVAEAVPEPAHWPDGLENEPLWKLPSHQWTHCPHRLFFADESNCTRSAKA